MNHTTKTLLTRTAIIALTTTAALAAHTAPAHAHATVTTDNTEAGTYTVLTFSIAHGCEGQPTNEITIHIPQPVQSVSPTVNPGWNIEEIPTDNDDETTPRTGEIRYTTDTPLPDGHRDTFELSLKIPEQTAGQTLHFPLVQTCTDGEHAWIQIAEDGQDPHDLDEPAPSIDVTAPGDDTAHDETATSDNTAEEDSSTGAWTYTALAVGTAGLVLAGVGLVRGRRES
ncbi:YcnI family copper-binding membrane protein [Salininema proteolyticum]|uniref:YcnI family protein n=1 Tax=Salininema proteolyticum TaxID=1607685 RepID=A0ABV8U302_9ACTN